MTQDNQFIEHFFGEHEEQRKESIWETVEQRTRLNQQGDFFTRIEGDMPEITLTSVHDIFDAGCGPGNWVLHMAYLYPDIQLVGGDISTQMLRFAEQHAQARKITNATFTHIDITKPWDIHDASFDVINGRFLQAALTKQRWPFFIKESFRVLRPGGHLRLTEVAATETNSHAFNRLLAILYQAFSLTQKSFAPGGLTPGITLALKAMLQNAGYGSLQLRPIPIDFSSGSEWYEEMRVNALTTYAPDMGVGQLAVTLSLVESKEHYEELYEQAMLDLHTKTFLGVCTLYTILGQKPSL